MKYIIYKIEIENYIYVGSTKNFNKRKCDHKHHCQIKFNRLIYNKINELGGWENVLMNPIEEIECDNKIQALIREEFHRKDLKATLNTVSCYSTVEDTKAKSIEYRIENRDHILEVKKQHYYANKEANNLKCKEYRNSHVEEIKLRQSNYHKENIEKIHLKNNEVKLCECGKSYTNANKARHIKSQFHISTLIL